jgi:lipoprotein-releasing system permease protein
LITRISVIGITVTTAALIILIAAFNGIESMVEKLYSEFDSNLTIRSAAGKTFDENTIPFKKISSLSEVKFVSKAIEEVVILKHEKKWVNAKLVAVENTFLKMINSEKHLVDGENYLTYKNEDYCLAGAGLLEKLNAYISTNEVAENLIIYFPKKDAKLRVNANPFRTEMIKVAGRVNYNMEVNDEVIVVPLDFAKNALDYENRISKVLINCKEKDQLIPLQEKLQNLLGSKFIVETHFEKNALIYQTSKTEKVIVICILVFVFIMAIFNLIASITMLYIEKEPNIKTMQSFGASKQFIFKIFFFEGILISFKGILFGIILGLIVALSQYYFKIVLLPNSGGQAFPMWITIKDTLLVFAIVSIISILASYFSITFLTKLNKSDVSSK